MAFISLRTLCCSTWRWYWWNMRAACLGQHWHTGSCRSLAPFYIQCHTLWTAPRPKKTYPKSLLRVFLCSPAYNSKGYCKGGGGGGCELWLALSGSKTALVWYRLKNKSFFSEVAKKAPDCCMLAQPLMNHRQILPCSSCFQAPVVTSAPCMAP